jgi:hypothetical protein
MAVSVNPRGAKVGIGDVTYDTLLWKGDTDDPAIGNGTMRSIWRIEDDYLNWRITMKFGTTSTFGTGNWYWTLPGGYSADFKKLGITDSAGANALDISTCVGCGTYLDASANYNTCSPVIRQSTGATKLYAHYAAAAGNFFNATSPMAWDNLDTISFQVRIPIVV